MVSPCNARKDHACTGSCQKEQTRTAPSLGLAVPVSVFPVVTGCGTVFSGLMGYVAVRKCQCPVGTLLSAWDDAAVRELECPHPKKKIDLNRFDGEERKISRGRHSRGIVKVPSPHTSESFSTGSLTSTSNNHEIEQKAWTC